MQVRISAIELRVALAIACTISVALVATTAYTNDFWMHFDGQWHHASFANKLLTFLDLGGENNIASWSSSMFLAWIGWVALLCFLGDDNDGRRDRLRFGWVLIALGFASLSFDELGSAHERLQLPEGYAGLILWYAPLMAVLPVYMLAFGFSRMRGDPGALGLIVFGCACLASIPLQEYYETEIRTGSTRPVLELALEEGTELAGMLAFMAAFTRYCAVRADQGPRLIEIDRRGFWIAWIAVFAAGLASREIVSSSLVPDALSGNPRNWFPAFAAFLVALIAWHTPGTTPSRRHVPHVLCAGLFLGLSLIVGTQIDVIDQKLSRLPGTIDSVRTAIILFSFLAGGWIATSAAHTRKTTKLVGG